MLILNCIPTEWHVNAGPINYTRRWLFLGESDVVQNLLVECVSVLPVFRAGLNTQFSAKKKLEPPGYKSVSHLFWLERTRFSVTFCDFKKIGCSTGRRRARGTPSSDDTGCNWNVRRSSSRPSPARRTNPSSYQPLKLVAHCGRCFRK